MIVCYIHSLLTVTLTFQILEAGGVKRELAVEVTSVTTDPSAAV